MSDTYYEEKRDLGYEWECYQGSGYEDSSITLSKEYTDEMLEGEVRAQLEDMPWESIEWYQERFSTYPRHSGWVDTNRYEPFAVRYYGNVPNFGEDGLRLGQLEYFWRFQSEEGVVYRLEWLTETRDFYSQERGEILAQHVFYILGDGGVMETPHYVEDAPPGPRSSITYLSVYGCNATLEGLPEAEEESPGISLDLDSETGQTERKRHFLDFYSNEDDPIGSLNLAWDHSKIQVYEVDSEVPLSSYQASAEEANGDTHCLEVQGIDAGQSALEWKYSRSGGQTTMKDVITIRAGEPKVVLYAPAAACDGNSIPITVYCFPTNLTPTQIQVSWELSAGNVSYGNPAGDYIQIDPGSDQYHWTIPNARWYATQTDHCNDTAFYNLRCKVSYPNNSPIETDRTLIVDAASKCAYGSANPYDFFSGEIDIQTEQIGPYRWKATVSQGTFVRDVKARINIQVSPDSQFYNLVVAEENFHKTQQFENPNHPIIKNYWKAEDVMTELQKLAPFYGATEKEAKASARREWERVQKQKVKEDQDRFLYPKPDRCAIEKEAKDAVGASYRLKMKCAYPACAN
jgi:hypothetical protein